MQSERGGFSLHRQKRLQEKDDKFQMFWSFGIHTSPGSVDGFELSSSSKAQRELVGEISIKDFLCFVFLKLKVCPHWFLSEVFRHT